MPYRRGATVVQQPMSPWGNFLGGMGQGFAGGVQDHFRRKEKDEALVATILEKFDPAFLATDYGQLIGEALGLGGSPVLQAAGDIGARQLSAETGGPAPMGPMTAAPGPMGPPGPGAPPQTPPAMAPPAMGNMPTFSPEAPVPFEAYTEYKKAEAREQALAKMQLELQQTTSEEEAKAIIKLNADKVQRGQEIEEYLTMREQLTTIYKESGMELDEITVKIGGFDTKFIAKHRVEAAKEKRYFEKNWKPSNYATEYFKTVDKAETFNRDYMKFVSNMLTTGVPDASGYGDVIAEMFRAQKRGKLEERTKDKTPEEILQILNTDYYLPILKEKNERLRELHMKGNVDVGLTKIEDVSKTLFVKSKKKGGSALAAVGDLLKELTGIKKPTEPLTQADTRSAVVAQAPTADDKSKEKIAGVKRDVENSFEAAKVDISKLTKSDLKFRLISGKSVIMREWNLSEQEFKLLLEEFGIRTDAEDAR